MRVLGEFCGGLETALFLQDGIDVGGVLIDDGFLGHDKNLDGEEMYSSRIGTRAARNWKSLLYIGEWRM